MVSGENYHQIRSTIYNRRSSFSMSQVRTKFTKKLKVKKKIREGNLS